MDRETRAARHACDFCRARKYKCSKERPSCQLCRQQKKSCHYTGQVVRSPLTRVHLTNVENRLHKLEGLFARLLPDVNIEDALAQNTTPTLNTHTSPDLPSPLKLEDAKSLDGPLSLAQSREETPPYEALPQEADGFDWKEETADVDDLADGMASLSVEPSGIGYLGSTSGVGFLRSFLLWTRNNSMTSLARDATSSQYSLQRPTHIHKIPESAISHQLMTSLIDAYFTNYHTSYPFLHEATFRAQYNALIKRPEKRAWHMLLNTVLALGAWTIGDGTNDLDDVFYRKARSVSQESSMFESGSLSLVQALLLLSNYAQKSNKPNTGWNYLGLAVRMAISLGFHRELPEWNISLFQREVRRRVWWGLFIFDSGASTTFGRAILLPRQEMVDVKPVLNIEDEDLVPITEEVPKERAEPTIYSSLIAQARFHAVSNSISDRLLSCPPVSPGEALSLNAILETWSAGLPWYFQMDQPSCLPYDWYLFARQRLCWRYRNLQILLTRPYLLSWAMRRMGSQQDPDGSAEESKCRKICIDSAHRTLVTSDAYIRQTPLTRLMSWYTLFFTFHAVLIPSVCLCVDPSSVDAPAWRADIDMTRDLLAFAFADNPLAQRCLDILNRLVPQQMPGTSNDAFVPFEPEPNPEELQAWFMDPADPMNMFGWTDLGQDMWQYN